MPDLSSPMNDIVTKKAVAIAKQVIDEQINPNIGCEKLAELCQQGNWPEELQIFDCLAHEQTGHENLGFTEENTAPEIVEACHELVARHS